MHQISTLIVTMTCFLANCQALYRHKSDVAVTASKAALEEKRKEFADGPNLSDFISGSITKGEKWDEYKGAISNFWILFAETAIDCNV